MAAPTEGVLMVEGATAVGRTPAGTAGVILKEAMAEAYLAIHIHLKVHKCVVVEK
jgi:hypothetical protein